VSWGSPPGGPPMGAPPPGGYGPPPGGGYGPPGYGPPGYGPPQPMYGPSYGGLQIVDPYGVEQRNSGMVLLLTFVTCGIYYFWWLYKTSEEIQRTLGDTTVSPGTDLLLAIVTCGLWAIYLQHRNVTKIHQALLSRDPYRKDSSQTILLLNLLAFVGIPTNLFAIYMVQEEFNALARAGQGGNPQVSHGIQF
jgi:hypothetical protein